MILMKIFSFILVLSLTFSSFASTDSVRSIVDEHRYFLTVEWDQKDVNLLKEQEELFLTRLSAVPAEELELYLRSNVSGKDFAIMKVRFAQALRNNENPLNVMRELSREQQGASWNGFVPVLVGVSIVAFSVFVAYTWFIHNQLECDGFYDCHGGE